MRTSRFLLALVLSALVFGSTQAVVLVKKAGASCSEPTYLIEEDFENTAPAGTDPGYDFNWDTVSGTQDPDASTTVPSDLSLRGSEALHTGYSGVAYLSRDTAASASDVYVAFLLRIGSSVAPTGTKKMIRIDDPGNIEVCAIWYRGAYEGWQAVPRGGTTAYDDAIFSVDTTYRVKVHYSPETSEGANDGICEVWTVAENATAWGTAGAIGTDGTYVGAPDIVRVEADVLAQEVYYDRIRVSSTDIPICALDTP